MAATLGVSAIIRRGDRLLLVRRGRQPYRGCWALPGGKVKPWERHQQALLREVAEETGLTVTIDRLAGVAEAIDETAGSHFVIIVYFAAISNGTPRPGDDAAELGWYDREELADLPLTPDLLRYLLDFGALQVP